MQQLADVVARYQNWVVWQDITGKLHSSEGVVGCNSGFISSLLRQQGALQVWELIAPSRSKALSLVRAEVRCGYMSLKE